jgi:hypothetical protein
MKPRPTLADYIIIAISPALIMALVGSLVFFLLELFYQGQYQARLQYVFALFVFASVLIGRISIEEGRERAMAFSLILAVAVLLVMGKFIEFSGIFARLSLVINAGLVVLILWCSNKLTWDCTVIDEQQDASGEGLLQTVGMDDGSSPTVDERPDLSGTTGSEPSEQARPEPPRSWWQRLIAARNKKHAPGVWVVYFSMAALPIFGVGQGFIFSQSDDSRRYVFKLLFVYVAAALGLLLTTSFLGLRRYLRQRNIEMPTQMAGAWLGTGAVMIVALLLFCMILPRRNAEYSISDIPAFAGSPDDLATNSWGFGNDGPEEDDAKREAKRKDAKKESGKPGDDEGTGQDKSKEGKGKSESDKSGQQSGESKEKSDQGEGEKKSSDEGREEKGGENEGSKQDPSKSKSPSKEDPQGKQAEEQENESKPAKSGEKQKQSKDGSEEQKSDTKKAEQKQSDQKKESQQKKEESQETESKQSKQEQPSQSKFDPAKLAKQIGGGMGMLLKLLYWVIVILIVGWFLWRYWAQVREAVRNFIQAMREFWAKLFGGSVESATDAVAEATDTTPPPRPFSDFPDPFRSGLANRLPLDQLIKYSFEAFEAWARERGFTRRRDETPHEFALHVAQSGAGISQEAIRLAELYSRAAYSRDTMPQTSDQYLQQLWRQLSAT